MNYNNNFYIPKQIDINIKQELIKSFIKPNDDNHEMSGRNQIKLMISFIDWLKTFLLVKHNININDMVLTETNSGFGGLTYLFMFYFKKINLVEFNNERIEFVKNNIKVYNRFTKIKSKFRYLPNNYLDIYRELKQDIIFSDFPWGGPCYKNKKSIRLCINDSNNNEVYLENIILDLYNSKSFKFYISLLPFNFDLEFFDSFSKQNNIVYDIFKVNNIKEKLLVVINHNAINQ
jgi:hypothetical protein